MKVRFSLEAENGLLSIRDYIARDSPSRAWSFVRALRERALQLSETPRVYPIVSRFSAQGNSSACISGLLDLLSRLDAVHIVRILHRARDIDALLGPQS